MMENYDESVEINHNPNWPDISDNPYKILFICGSGSVKTNVLLNLINNHDQILLRYIDTSKIYSSQSTTAY